MLNSNRIFVYFFFLFVYLSKGFNIIIVASKSTSFNEKNNGQLVDNGMLSPIANQNTPRTNEPLERFRRLIPFMAFYVPTTNADYLPYGPVTNQMVIDHF